MKTLSEIKDYMIENATYEYDLDSQAIIKGKLDKQIEFVLSYIRPEEEVKFAVLTSSIYNGYKITCGGNSILLITSDRILYGQKGKIFSTLKFVNIDDCRDIEAETFGIFGGQIKINTMTELIRFGTMKSQTTRIASLIDDIIQKVLHSKKANEKPIIKQTPIDELKKMKELLDLGIITQDDFERKKKQILGL